MLITNNLKINRNKNLFVYTNLKLVRYLGTDKGKGPSKVMKVKSNRANRIISLENKLEDLSKSLKLKPKIKTKKRQKKEIQLFNDNYFISFLDYLDLLKEEKKE